MPDQIQWRGGSTAEHAVFTGAVREITVDTTKKTLVVHDGVTVGGLPLMREDMANSTASVGVLQNLSGHSGALITNGVSLSWLDGPLGERNFIHNSCFSVNQRAKSGTVTLAAGAYGHDRWKAGATGCTYNFAVVAGLTTVTITAGSLIQVIESCNLPGGTGNCTLSWTGAALGKIGGGSYAASPIIAAVTGGANLNVEFYAGTLTKVQLEPGSVATPFIRPNYTDDRRRCQRYYQQIGGKVAGDIWVNQYTAVGGTEIVGTYSFGTEMARIPTMTVVGTWTVLRAGQPTVITVTPFNFVWQASSTTVGVASVASTLTAYFTASAEL